jgi:hypothetical protein
VIYVYFLAAVFIFVVAVCLVKGRRSFTEKDRKYIALKWHEVSHTDARTCILEADKLLDFALGKFLGQKYFKVSLGEKLKMKGGIFSDLNGVWFAHKLRNKIAHELDFHVSMAEFKRALSAFRKAFIDLGVKIK